MPRERKNAKQLAETFRDEDDNVRTKKSMILHASGRCVPTVQPNGMNAILFCLPHAYSLSGVVCNLRNRYQNAVDSERFSTRLQHILWKYIMWPTKRTPEMCPELASQDSQSDTNVISSSLENHPHLTGALVQEHYATLEANRAPHNTSDMMMPPESVHQYLMPGGLVQYALPSMQGAVINPVFAYQY